MRTKIAVALLLDFMNTAQAREVKCQPVDHSQWKEAKVFEFKGGQVLDLVVARGNYLVADLFCSVSCVGLVNGLPVTGTISRGENGHIQSVSIDTDPKDPIPSIQFNCSVR